MGDRKYQTIDPLIMETLNLNQKRIHHIFDILHGRDSTQQYRTRPISDRKQKSSTLNSSPSNRLPRVLQQYAKAKSPRQMPEKQIKTPKQSVSSLINYSSINASQLQNIKQQKQYPRQLSYREKKSKSQKQATIQSVANIEQQLSVQPQQRQILQRKQRLIQDYGGNQLRRNKSLQINPKDVYRIQIQGLVSKLTQIEELEDSEKLMKRLKRRYQHLRKFDKNYYLKLCQNELIML